MTIRLEPLLPLPVVLLLGAAALLLLGYFYWRLRPIVPRRLWWGLLAAKLLSVALLVLILLNPFFVRRRPDTRRFNVAILADATASMQTRDCDDQRRLEVLRGLLAPRSGFRRKIERLYPNTSVYLFAGDELRHLPPGADFAALPGLTDIDGALKELLEGPGQRLRLGAVVLLTDGLDNQGVTMMDGGTVYRRADIPVHVVGIGDSRVRDDLEVRWTDLPDEATRARPFQVTGVIRRNFTGAFQTRLEASVNGRDLEPRDVSFTADQQEVAVTWEHAAFTGGFHGFRLHAPPLPGEDNTLNNTDMDGLQVKDPEAFRVLYFAHNLGWDYKYLKLLADAQPRLNLDALIRLSPESWFVKGVDEATDSPPAGAETPVDPAAEAGRTDQARGFPEAEILNRYEALILATDSLNALDAEARARLLAFVTQRGGGLILAGPVTGVPEELAPLLPVKRLSAALGNPAGAVIEVPASSVYVRPDDAGNPLHERLTVPLDATMAEVPPDALKPAAIAAARVRGAAVVAVAAQPYGAGKVAWVNLDHSWQWVMSSDAGQDHFALFWGRLVSWVASSSRQRLTMRPPGGKLALGAEHRLFLDVLDARYEAANQAEVTVGVRHPDGSEQTMTFFPSPRVDGRFVGKFIPREPGEYRFLATVTLPDGEQLQWREDYLVHDSSPERAPAPLAEKQLRNLAEMTGGKYWHWRDVGDLRRLPVTGQVSYLEERSRWLNSWAFLLVALLGLFPDWVLRRRIGLR